MSEKGGKKKRVKKKEPWGLRDVFQGSKKGKAQAGLTMLIKMPRKGASQRVKEKKGRTVKSHSFFGCPATRGTS